MTRNSSLLIISALFLRLILSAFFYHPDIKSQNFHAQYLAQGVFNIYDYLSAHRQTLPYSDTYNYPPIIYYFQGLWLIFAKSLVGPGLLTWLNDWGTNANLHPGMFAYLLILKLPYLVADLVILKLLLKINPIPNRNKYLSFLWLFNPLTLYGVYMIGQFDIFPTLFTVLALWFTFQKKIFWAGAAIGIGAALKSYPLLFLPILVISTETLKSKIWLIEGFILGYLIPIVPFLSSGSFINLVFKSQFSTAVNLPLFAITYLAIILLGIIRHRFTNKIESFLAVSLSILLFTKFHPQWLVWCTPFLILTLVLYPKLKFLFLIFIIFAFSLILTLPDQYVLFGLFVPLNPYLGTIPPLSSFIPQINFIKNILSIVFAFIGLLIIIKTYVKNNPITN